MKVKPNPVAKKTPRLNQWLPTVKPKVPKEEKIKMKANPVIDEP